MTASIDYIALRYSQENPAHGSENYAVLAKCLMALLTNRLQVCSWIGEWQAEKKIKRQNLHLTWERVSETSTQKLCELKDRHSTSTLNRRIDETDFLLLSPVILSKNESMMSCELLHHFGRYEVGLWLIIYKTLHLISTLFRSAWHKQMESS